ncbi:flagellar hook-associated protein FlgK [Rhodopseudomonas palustris]|uniref:flagellar hook-associated protein FlgK n=1 Tax=Rhodopseudomonas palustris TaxID=1076 RepID=UPI000CEC79B6|nr:flagellar hook-associated protein FlgK [Rhodopseudomonas palustris]PPQ43373.1 flagellar hook-associated protein FlgK [Rhodopseudomonas palustris]QLH72936.1 flagellar hook-associated protein FlgK [Rhodopseudomonas palustris]RHZ94408.1 flagellar hook-associated protein FlgK [Rhodopseudomonas palustris]
MSLGDALAIAMAGLRVNQATMSLVSSNVANAETPGYVRKTVNQSAVNAGETGTSVKVVGVDRQLDDYILAQLRTETSGGAYASLRSDFLKQLQGLFGDPNSTGTLENSYNGLTTALQALATSPDSTSARIAVLNAAQAISSNLNSTSNGIQTLRAGCETGIADAVTTANNLMQQIANINTHIQTNPLGGTSTDAATSAMLDQRDQAINQLSQLMDIRVVTNGANQVTVFTGSGVQLVGMEAAKLTFNAQGTVSPTTMWNPNTAISDLGSIRVGYANGSSSDLTSSLKSGKLAAYVELRDKTLVQAQTQLDQFAASLSSALSDKTTAGTAVTSGTQAGFSLDLSSMKTGNTVNISYTDTLTGAQHTVTVVRVDDPSVLPLPQNATADPNDYAVGIDFSGLSGSVVSQLNAALNSRNLQFSGTAPNITVLNNAGFSTITAASVTSTETSLTGGTASVPLFNDNGAAYTGAINGYGSQMTGYAQRISVNADLIKDNSRLVVYSTSPLTAAGDTTRPDFLVKQLNTSKYLYSAKTGIGSDAAPYKGTLLSYLQQFVSQQGSNAAAAQQLSEGQNVVLNTLQQKFSTSSGVNMDEEMAHLLSLQNAYAANARVMSTINQMYQSLMQAI